jgi:GntR family transcriptional regulator, arabinose operon transcriptional repressor
MDEHIEIDDVETQENDFVINQEPPLYEKIRDILLEGINTKKWKPGEKLPSENELSSQFGVSRWTIRYAIECLMDENIVVRLPGKGSFVADPELITREFQSGTVTILSENFEGIASSMAFTQFLVVHGIRDVMERNGFSISLKSFDGYNNDKSSPKEELQLSSNTSSPHILVSPHVNLQKYFAKHNIPCVVVGNVMEGLKIPGIHLNTFKMGFDATNYLLELGHRKIGVICGDLSNVGRHKMMQGYDSALRYGAYSLDQSLVVSATSEIEIRDSLPALLDRGVTALEISDEYRASKVWDALSTLGVDVPSQISLLVLERDKSQIQRRPKYSSMWLDHHDMGQMAADMLLHLVKGEPLDNSEIIVQAQLLEGMTTAQTE